MKPLLVLLVVFVVSLFVIRFVRGGFHTALAGRIAMAAMLMFTAIAHFAFTQGMAMMLPDVVPYKIPLVYFTGVMEIVAAFALFVPGWRAVAGWMLIAFFIVLLPANIYAAYRHVDYQQGTYNGSGLAYLWFRIPLQLFFMLWVYFATIKGQSS